MRNKILGIVGAVAAIFLIWLISGILHEAKVPFYTVNLPLTGLIVSIIAIKILDED